MLIRLITGPNDKQCNISARDSFTGNFKGKGNAWERRPIVIPPPVGEAGFSSAYVRPCVGLGLYVCNNYAALWRDPCCSSTLVKISKNAR